MIKRRRNITFEVLGILLGIIWLAPFYLMIVNSLKTKKQIFGDTLGFPSPATFDNYIKAAEQLNFARTFFNSLLISVISVVLIILFASMASYALSRTKTKASGIIFLIFAAAMLIPFQSVMIPLIELFGNVDMLNRVGLIFMYLGFGSSLSIFLFHGSLKGISVTLDEAATIDGCNTFQTFWKIVFPMLKPITVTVMILNIIWIWNDYLLPSLVINHEGMETIPLKMFYFFGEYTKQWHLAMAGLTLAIIPVIIIYFFAQKQIIAGITQGAVK
jgi:raffinose/stachyose/melibiose transport system permease protein